MASELTPDLRRAIHQLPGNEPLRLVDPDTNTVYVLLRADLFDHVQAAIREGDDDKEIAETYTAQSQSALEAGWNASEMADYDNYDQNRNKQCQ